MTINKGFDYATMTPIVVEVPERTLVDDIPSDYTLYTLVCDIDKFNAHMNDFLCKGWVLVGVPVLATKTEKYTEYVERYDVVGKDVHKTFTRPLSVMVATI